MLTSTKLSELLIVCRMSCTFLGVQGADAAETHTIFIEDQIASGGEFQPNSLTIEVGDSVIWWAQANEFNHTVVADDLSWRSDTIGLRWQWEEQFNAPGEVRYHCDIHSAPGRDINVFENGIITVSEEDNGTPFQINAGVSDAWFNPVTNGQGFFIIVWEESNLVFLSWFTFDSERPPDGATAKLGGAGQRWVTALGSFEGDTASLDVYLSTGGVFDSPEPPVETNQDPIGTISISWADCNAGTLIYNFPSLTLSGSIPIERIVPDNVAACEAGQPQPNV